MVRDAAVQCEWAIVKMNVLRRIGGAVQLRSFAVRSFLPGLRYARASRSRQRLGAALEWLGQSCTG